MKQREIKSRSPKKNLSNLDSATGCLCVCNPSLKVKTLQSLLYTRQFPTRVQIITYEKDIVTFLVSKTTPSDSYCCVNGCDHLKCLYLVQKLWTSASVKLWMSFTVCISRTPLLLSVDLKIAFWFLNDRKQREVYFGISVIFNIFLYKSLFQFCILLKLSIVTLIYNLN